VSIVQPDDASWAAVTAALVADRLNVLDLTTAADQWAESSTVSRIVPADELVEAPGASGSRGSLSDQAHLAAPKATRATTRGPLPSVLHRRKRRRPELS
jgi:hypothetical protein